MPTAAAPPADPPKKQTIRWYKLDKPIEKLDTDAEHEITVQREAIPLILVPGIMGSRLRQAATGTVVWDPPDGIGASLGAAWDWGWSGPVERHRRLIGPDFNEGFLVVDSHSAEKLEELGVPKGRGAQAQARGWGTVHWSSYGGLLNFLDTADFGPLRKVFAFPVYAIGYNWSASNRTAGKYIATRIDEIIAENNNDKTFCERVIMLTHSMGGLATRSALLLHGAAPKMLGVLHGAQPVTGAAAAYKRMKAGAEGIAQLVLGSNGPEITAVLGNAPGGLELLPTNDYVNENGEKTWLFVTASGGQRLRALPAGDPYTEIYQERTQFYRLVTPEHINPEFTGAPTQRDPWSRYVQHVNTAKSFHQSIKLNRHDKTYTFHGIGRAHLAWDRIEWIVKRDKWFFREPSAEEVAAAVSGQMPATGGNGEGKEQFTVAGTKMEGELQDPSGQGDGTVPMRSGDALTESGAVIEHIPVDGIEHQMAYDDTTVRRFVTRVVGLMAKEWFDTRPRG